MWRWALWQVVRGGHEGGTLVMGSDAGQFVSALSAVICTKERPCEDTVGRWPSVTQGESSHQPPTLWAP